MNIFMDTLPLSNPRKNPEILIFFRRVADESSLDTPVRQLALGLCRFVFFGTLQVYNYMYIIYICTLGLYRFVFFV